MAFSVVDTLKTVNIHQINIDKIHKAYNRREERNTKPKNSFIITLRQTERKLLLNSLKIKIEISIKRLFHNYKMFCLFNSCIEEERRKVSHNRNVRFNEEVIVVNIDRTPEFMKF